MKMFRVRSANRDAKTDADRLASIGAALASALQSAEFEQMALNARVTDAETLASFAVGTGTDEYVDREEKDKRRIVAYETQITQGRKRLQALGDHIDGLRSVQNLFDDTFNGRTKSEESLAR